MSQPAGPKSVDWLDALREQGAEAVRRELADAARGAIDQEEHARRERMRAAKVQDGRRDAAPTAAPASGGGESDPATESGLGDASIYPKDPADAALLFLCECYPPANQHHPYGATWRLVTWKDRLYEFETEHGRHRQIDEAEIRSIQREWARTKEVWRVHKEKDEETGKSVNVPQREPYVPTEQSLKELRTATKDLTVIRTEGMGVWLDRAYEPGVRFPRYTRRPAERVLSAERAAAEGLPAANRLLGFTNGALDVEALVRDEVRLIPSTERLFAASPLPHPWPESFAEAVRTGSTEAWFAEHCPTWLMTLRAIDDGRRNFSASLVRHFGRAMISDLSPEQIPLLIGAPGSRKSTLLEPVLAVFGDAAVPGMTLDALADPKHLLILEGRRLVVFPDAEVAGAAGAKAITETLKKMAEGNALHAHIMHTGPHQFRNTALPVIVANIAPNLRDAGGALAKRFSCYTFRHSLRGTAEMDQTVKERVKAEAPWIMVYIVWHGLRAYLQDLAAGRDPLPRPDDHAQVIELFSNQADTIGHFVSECLEPCTVTGIPGVPPGEQPSVWIGSLHKLAMRWASKQGKEDQIGSESLFAQRLQSSVMGWGCTHKGKVLRTESGEYKGRPSHWFGLRIRPGVLAELYDDSRHEDFPLLGVWPREDGDWLVHRATMDELYPAEAAGSRTLPLTISPPTEGGTDA